MVPGQPNAHEAVLGLLEKLGLQATEGEHALSCR